MDPIAARRLDAQLDYLRTQTDTFAEVLLKESRVPTLNRNNFNEQVRALLISEAVVQFLKPETKQADGFAQHIQPELVRRAQKFFIVHGLPILTALLTSSLPEAYAAGRGAQVLYLSGEMVSSPARRVRETLLIVLTMLTPDPDIPITERGITTTLHPGYRGATVARRVRLLHAMSRKLIEDQNSVDKRWDKRGETFRREGPPPLGEPICQEDLAGTLLTFTETVFEGLPKLGVWPTARETEAWFHVWDVVGRHLGVGVENAFAKNRPSPHVTRRPPRMGLPDSPLSSRDLALAPDFGLWETLDRESGSFVLDAIRHRHRSPTHEGKVLINALLHELEGPLPRILKGFPSALIRYLAGDDVGDVLGIRSGKVDFWLSRLRSNRRIDKSLGTGFARPTCVAGGELGSLMTKGVLQQFIDQGRQSTLSPTGGRDEFRIYGPLCRSWGLRSDGNGHALSPPLSLRR